MKLCSLLLLSILIACCLGTCSKAENKHSFEKNGQRININLEQYSDSAYALILYVNDSLTSTWKLDYPVYRTDFGDVNNNGIPEILVGTIKPTRFDPKPDKRLFIFKITEDNYIRPLWLGSRVSQPLVDFKLKGEKTTSRIRTIEKERDGTFLVSEYRWRGFGLEFVEYLERNIPLKDAQTKLNSK